MEAQALDANVDVLMAELAQVRAQPALPRVVVMYGETGRGKTFAVQRFYDRLARLYPGYWSATLAPAWPPAGLHHIRHGRKQVEAIREAAPTRETPPFFWIGTGASPAEGAITVDMGAVIGEQIARALAPGTASAKQRRGIAREVADLAIDAIGALIAPVGLTKTAITHASAVRQLARSDGDWLSERRAAIYAAFSACARSELRETPMIVVLDDAQNAGFETLFLLSGLVAPDAEAGIEPIADAKRYERFLPSALTVTSPAPLLIVCTAWEHRVRGTFSDPFQAWMQEVLDLGLSVNWHECGELPRDVAAELLHTWDADVSVAPILEHIAHDDDGDSVVNPLVLAECIGGLEEQRDPFSGTLAVTDEVVATLPATPDQHIRDRLERLRQEPEFGSHAFAVLSLLAHFAGAFPNQFLTELGRRLDAEPTVRSASALLEKHLLIRALGPPAPAGSQLAQLSSSTVDPDVHRYMSRAAVSPTQRSVLVGASRSLMLWARDELLPQELERLPVALWAVIVSALTPAAELVLDADDEIGDGPDARLIAETVLRRDLEGDLSQASSAALAFAYARGAGTIVVADEKLLDGCRQFAPSRTSAAIVRRRLQSLTAATCTPAEQEFIELLRPWRERYVIARLLADVEQRVGHIDEAIALLRPVAGTIHGTAIELARLLEQQGEVTEAIEVLRRVADRSPDAARALADVLGRRDVDSAIEALRPFARLQGVAVELAHLLERRGDADEAIEVLRPLADRFQEAAVELARLLARRGDADEAIEVLRPLADRFQEAAVERARLLARRGDADEAIEVLRPVAGRFQEAAVELAGLLARRGEGDAAIAVLRPVADRFANAATELAHLLVARDEKDAAMEVLSHVADRFQEPAIELADMKAEQGDLNGAIAVLRPLTDRFQEAGTRLAELLVQRGDVNGAIEVLRLAASRFPEVTTRLADLLVAQDDVDGAIEVLRPAAERFETSAMDLADLLVERGNVDQAIETLSRVADRFPGAAVRLAGLLTEAGDIDGAIHRLTPLAERFENAAVELATLVARRDGPDAAIELLRPIAPNSQPATNTLAQLLLSQGRPDEAMGALRSRATATSRDMKSLGLLTASLLLSADADAATAVLRDVRDDRRGAYMTRLFFGTTCGAIARAGRPDLLRLLIELDASPYADHAAAERLLWTTQVARRRGYDRDAYEVALDVWPLHDRREAVRSTLTGSVWAWAREAKRKMPGPPMTPLQAASKLEVLMAFGYASKKLSRTVLRRLQPLVEEDDSLKAVMVEDAEFSRIALAVVREMP